MSGLNINEEDPNVIAARAERELNSNAAKQGTAQQSDSSTESGVNQSVESRFPGAEVKYGSEASGAGDGRDIPDDEGGEINPQTGRQTKAGDFEGIGGPEEKIEVAETERGGDQDLPGNVRQGGETRRP